ncbi:WD domain, G-beta repeat [Plasmodiophora brassicae]
MSSATAILKAMSAPCPTTRRGYGMQMHSSAKTGQFLYCNGKNVILRSLADPSACDVFSDHKCNVSVAKFSPNGEWVASGDSRGRVLVWGTKSKLIKAEVNVCRDVLDLAWSDDGKRIVAVGDGTDSFAKAFLWDSGSTVGDITNHSKRILSVDIRQVRPYRVATASEDRQVNFYQGPPFRFDKMFDRHTRFPNQVRFSPDGNHLVSVGSDKSIFVFDGKTGDFVKDIADAGNAPGAHTGSIWSLSWAPNSTHILTVSGDSTAKIWNVVDGTVVQTFPFPSDGTSSHQQVGALWHDDDTLVTVSLSGAINFLDRANPGKPRRVLHGHSVPVSSMEVDGARGVIYSGDNLGSVFRWNPATGDNQELTDVGDGAKNVSALAIARDSHALRSAAFDDILRSTPDGAPSLAGEGGVAIAGQPVAIAAGAKDLTVIVTRKKTLVVVVGNAEACTVQLSFMPTDVALSPDEAEIAVSGDKLVHLFSLAKNQAAPLKTLAKHMDLTACVAYSPDGRLLVSGDNQRGIYIWDRSTGEVTNPSGWRYHAAKVTTACFSPSSNLLATGSVDQSVLVWTDLTSFDPNRIKIDPAHVGGVSHVRFLNDKTVVSTGDDRAIKVWDLPN